MAAETGTDFFEWVDHIILPAAEEAPLRDLGFVEDEHAETANGENVFECPRATLPRVLICPAKRPDLAIVALRPESVADFIASHQLSERPEGEPFSRYRSVHVASENRTALTVVERRSYRGFVAASHAPGELDKIILAKELWRTRKRIFDNDAEGFKVANGILDKSIQLVGRDLSCQFFFESERAYWESRNNAARIQKRRQDQLGLGWGNHDHHTFRCSRAHFVDLVEFLLKLGFEKRERYYAGAEAGWGAQISEQPVTGIVVFADVDLMPEETSIDFSKHKLPAAKRLATRRLHHVEQNEHRDPPRELARTADGAPTGRTHRLRARDHLDDPVLGEPLDDLQRPLPARGERIPGVVRHDREAGAHAAASSRIVAPGVAVRPRRKPASMPIAMLAGAKAIPFTKPIAMYAANAATPTAPASRAGED